MHEILRIIFFVWLGGILPTLVVIGFTHPAFRRAQTDGTPLGDIGIAILCAVIWPVTGLILTPVLAGAIVHRAAQRKIERAQEKSKRIANAPYISAKNKRRNLDL